MQAQYPLTRTKTWRPKQNKRVCRASPITRTVRNAEDIVGTELTTGPVGSLECRKHDLSASPVWRPGPITMQEALNRVPEDHPI